MAQFFLVFPFITTLLVAPDVLPLGQRGPYFSSLVLMKPFALWYP